MTSPFPRNLKGVIVAIATLLAFEVVLFGQNEFYVSPSGDDNNPGSAQAPVATLGKAISLAGLRSQQISSMVPDVYQDVSVRMMPGEYPMLPSLADPNATGMEPSLQLGPSSSGTAKS